MCTRSIKQEIHPRPALVKIMHGRHQVIVKNAKEVVKVDVMVADRIRLVHQEMTTRTQGGTPAARLRKTAMRMGMKTGPRMGLTTATRKSGHGHTVITAATRQFGHRHTVIAAVTLWPQSPQLTVAHPILEAKTAMKKFGHRNSGVGAVERLQQNTQLTVAHLHRRQR